MPMRILIAEDDPYSRQILELMLAKEKSWQVVSAKDGTQAWNLLQDGPAFDVCILDIMMPGLDGLQLATQMRADPRYADQRIMFCTALNDRGTVQQAAALGVSQYITKPYQRETVFRQLRRIESELTSVCRIESLDKMVERLGLDEDVLCALLKGLQAEIDAFLQPLRTLTRPPADPEFSLKTNALKGAAANLGAVLITSRLAVLETAGAADWKAVVEQIAMENEHLRLFLGTALPASTPA